MPNLSQLLEPIANYFRNLGIPEPIVHWGHPLMMAMVVFIMGSFVGLAGWRGRLVTDVEAAVKSRSDHRKLAPLMFFFHCCWLYRWSSIACDAASTSCGKPSFLDGISGVGFVGG